MPEDSNENIKEVAILKHNGRLYEIIYDPDKDEAKFVSFNEQSGKIEEFDQVVEGNITFKPLIDKFVKSKAVLLPTKPEPYESEEQLLQDIKSHIHKYIDIPEEYEKICSWTILVFWLYDKLNMMIPYLRALGDTGCGKSRFLDVIGGISYKTMMVGGSVTPAIMYRVAEKWKGTMIIDEADWRNTDEYSEVVKIINCNQPNRPIFRCSRENYDDIKVFDSWCPRIFATRRNFKDVAAESRMLTIQMKETSRNDIPVALDDEFYKEQSKLRNQLLMYRLKNWNRVNSSIKPTINLTGLEPRSKQIVFPIAIVFNHREDILGELSSLLQTRQQDLVKDRAETDDGVVINAYLELVDQGKECITSSDIASLVQGSGEQFEKITPQTIGHIMKSLGFKNEVRRMEGKSRRCHIHDADLINKLKKRYSLKPMELKCEDCTLEPDDGEELQRLQKLQPMGIWQRIIGRLK
jgi:hypothetical protein